MFTPQRTAQFGLGAVMVVLVLCMGVLIANGMGTAHLAASSVDRPALQTSEMSSHSPQTLASAAPVSARN